MVVNTECAVHVRWLQQREDCVVLGWRVGAKAVGLLGSTAAAAGVRRIVSITALLVITGMLAVNVLPVWKSRRSVQCHKTVLSMPQTTTLHWIEGNFTAVQRCTIMYLDILHHRGNVGQHKHYGQGHDCRWNTQLKVKQRFQSFQQLDTCIYMLTCSYLS